MKSRQQLLYDQEGPLQKLLNSNLYLTVFAIVTQIGKKGVNPKESTANGFTSQHQHNLQKTKTVR